MHRSSNVFAGKLFTAFSQVHDNPVASPVDAPTQWPLRNLRRLLEELIAIAHASHGREDFRIDLLPVGEEFDPLSSV